MKLNETNARFAVVRTKFHGGGVISFHNSLKEAEKSANHNRYYGCECGCCAVVPITVDAQKEMHRNGYEDLDNEYGDYMPRMFGELPSYNPSMDCCKVCL